MFAFLRGIVAEKSATHVVIDVQGVGYEVAVSAKTLDVLNKDEESKLSIHMHIAEGILTLYGFRSQAEKEMFRRLISISRVGPKLAISALNVLNPEELAAAILSGDEKSLARVPGMGKKTAQRIILELNEKISTNEAVLSAGDWSASGSGDLLESQNETMQAISALIALGYDAGTASRAVSLAASKASNEENLSLEKLISAALKSLG